MDKKHILDILDNHIDGNPDIRLVRATLKNKHLVGHTISIFIKLMAVLINVLIVSWLIFMISWQAFDLAQVFIMIMILFISIKIYHD